MRRNSYDGRATWLSGAEIIWRRLNDCGGDGWEFVTFLPALPAQHFKGDPPNPYVVHAIFKRKAH